MLLCRLSQRPHGAYKGLLIFPGSFVNNRRWCILLLSSSNIDVLRNTTMVARCAAKDSMLSLSGTGVLPAIRVMITLWEMSGSVYSRFKAEAAPQKELTPGQES